MSLTLINLIIIIIIVLYVPYGPEKVKLSGKVKEKIGRAIRLYEKAGTENDGAEYEEDKNLSNEIKEKTGREIPPPEKAWAEDGMTQFEEKLRIYTERAKEDRRETPQSEKAGAENGGARHEENETISTEDIKEETGRETPQPEKAGAENGGTRHEENETISTEDIKEETGRETPPPEKAGTENGGTRPEEYEARKQYFRDAVSRAAKNAQYDPTPENIGVQRICAAIARIDAVALDHGDDVDALYSFEQEMGMFCSVVMNSKSKQVFKAGAISAFNQIYGYLWDNRFFAPVSKEQINQLYTDRVIEYYREKKDLHDVVRMYTGAYGNAHGWPETMTESVSAMFDEALVPIGEDQDDGPLIRTDVQKQRLPGEERQKNAWDKLTNKELEKLKRETGEKIVNTMDFCFNEVRTVCRKVLAQEERKQLVSSLIVLAAGTLQEKAPLADEKAFMLDIAVMLNRLRISENIESLPSIVTDYESSVYLRQVLSEVQKTERGQAFSGQTDHHRGAVLAFIDAVLMKALVGVYGEMKDENVKKCYQDCGTAIHEKFVRDIAYIAKNYGLGTE